MATPQRLPKLSLAAQYDDFCRNNKVLMSDCVKEFNIYAENQVENIRKWNKIEAEVHKLKTIVANLESDNGRLETKIKHLKNLLEDSDSTKRKIEWEKKCLERTIAAVKDVILSDGVVDNQTKEKLAFLNCNYKPSVGADNYLQTIEESVGSLFSLSDIDQTDDDLENCRSNRRSRRSKGKRGSNETNTSLKRKKLDNVDEFLHKVNREIDQQSNSETASTSSDIPAASQQAHKLDPTSYKYNTYDCRYDTDSNTSNTPLTRQASMKVTSKSHQFVTKTVMKSVKCFGCRQNMGYLKQSLKCQSCGITYHPECKNLGSMICFPITNTPTKGTTGKVADYTSTTSPMIPPLIFHCVREIESRGMKEIGIYRNSSNERDVKNLIDKFVSGHIIPNLNEVDVNTLCVAVKVFLRSLKEPLITYKSWQAFVDAANSRDTVQSSYALLGLVSNLPQANRDTLSYLILHWQKVAESSYCKMNIENLSRVLGPAVIGYSTAEPSEEKILQETTHQYQVMRRLLSIANISWQGMMSVELFQSIEGTPENLPAPKGRLLGPVYASVQKRKSLTLRKTPLTPRNSKFNSKPSRTYFSSPLLK